ncbi:hypothetical protein HDZ31DRAFT_32512 [Schizophyllum fasciatum]
MPTPEITVLYFAAASTATGRTSETIQLPSTTSAAATAMPAPNAPADVPNLTNPANPTTGNRTSNPNDPHPFPLSALPALLAARHPGTNLLDILRTSQWSVDAEMVDDPAGVVLRGGEEVAVICPVSGG